ncbi:CHASE2 domain-containing protein [Spirochaeta africana]|nr:CHASE2 domain-containing protein [Spirochaeta africana]
MRRHRLIQIGIALAVPVVFSALLLIPRFRYIDFTFYDQLLGLRPAVPESPRVLLLNVDDDAISRVGTWPWSRSILADGLLRLGEFGAAAAIFDIEYIDPSPMGVAPEVLNEEFPRVLNDSFADIQNQTEQLFFALQQEMIPLADAEDFIFELGDLTRSHRDRLLETARAIARDNDRYHGTAAGLFGRAYYTNTILDAEDQALPGTEAAAAFARENFGIPNLILETENYPSGNAIQPVIEPIGRNAVGAGFPNVPVDPDGVRRRIDLVQGDGRQIFGQLAFRPLLDYLGNPEVVVRDRSILLRGASYPDGSTRNVRIPRSTDGRMLITWPPRGFDDTFRQLSYSRIYTLDQFESDLVFNIEQLTEARFLTGHELGMELLPWYREIQQLREEMFAQADRDLYELYLEERAYWFMAVEEVFQTATIEPLLAQIDRILASENLADDDRLFYQETREEIIEQFNATAEVAGDLLQRRAELLQELNDSFIIIGWTGISTTDIGVNPFDERYMNVGTHAAVANTILQRDFLIELPYIVSILTALLLSLLIGWLVRNTSARRTIILGISMLIAVTVAVWALFVFGGWYLRPVVILFSIGSVFIALSLFKFYLTESEKRYISGAFSRYLSQDVVREIINDPSRLNLGGEKREMTALFTDVKGFSTISEQMDPQDLVTLLNRYLSAMSDIILELGGTIDKYEGDAIIAFFGAPLDVPDHAYRACLASARMKQMERELNRQFEQEGISPGPLLTRIGMNSGEMVVGNMGTERKMDYTMMGHNVNLAARLEGVNKQYSSWILASQSTIDQIADGSSQEPAAFVWRRLDRVRVVGVNEPVRLYEILSAADGTAALLNGFEQGLELFEKAQFHAAMQQFSATLEEFPDDGPSRTYLERCRKFLDNPPPANWDGVFSLTQK